MTKMYTWQDQFYGGLANQKTSLQIVYGLQKELDKTDFDYWNPESIGIEQYDPLFDISSIEAQQHIIYVCDQLLYNLTDDLYEKDEFFTCFMNDFKDYGMSQYNYSFPFQFSVVPKVQRFEFMNLLKEWLTKTSTGSRYLSSARVGYIPETDELNYVYVDFKIQANRFDSFEKKQKELDKWEERMKEWNDIAIINGAFGVSRGYQSSGFSWAWIATDRGFVRSALQGIGIALPLAFISLLVSTQNILVSFYAITAIIGIVVCEVALMVIQGWELGISESIAIVMMIGFSVDYVVHLGNSYIECEISGDRAVRTTWALYTMAISVVFGALTTFGSGFWLIWPDMMFFKKFGFLVVTVISISVYFALVYFMSLLAAIGPNDKCGYCPIWKLLTPCCNYCDKTCGNSKYNICGTMPDDKDLVVNDNDNDSPVPDDDHKGQTNIIEKQPNLRFAWITIHYPCSVIGVFALIFIIVSAADYLGFKFAPQSTHAYFVKGDYEVDKMDAITLAQRELLENSDIKSPVQTQRFNEGTLVVMFKTKDNSNILSVDNLKFISDITGQITATNQNEYSKLCLKSEIDGSWPQCSFGSVWNPLIDWYNGNNGNVNQTELDTWLNDINTYNGGYDLRESYWNSFEEGFSNTLTSTYYRGFWNFGFPYPDVTANISSFLNRDDRLDDQVTFYSDYIFPIYQDIQLKDHGNNIEVVIFGDEVRLLQMDQLVSAGVAYSVFSVITVVLLMWLHLRSLFLAITSIFQILLGFPFAFFVYRWIAQITYFDTMSTLVIFLILGIGADDVFVFVDAWRQSPTFVGDDLVDRMSFTYRRASKAMVVTTATTFFAFIATGLSPLLPISAFGFWAACVVAMNYVLVITLFPAILSWWYQHVKSRERLFCCNKCQKDDIIITKDIQDDDQIDPVETLLKGEGRCVEKFFRDKWFWFLSKAKWILIAITLCIMGVAAWQASKISPLSKQEEFFLPDVCNIFGIYLCFYIF